MSVQVALTLVAALIITLTGALFGPYVLDRRRATLEARAQRRINRQGPYVNFVASVEDLQLLLDASAKGESIGRERILEAFRAMEIQRAQVDIVGSSMIRVWAYRCRLALAGMDRDLVDRHHQRAHFRSKLHDARKGFVILAREELSLEKAEVETSEDSMDGHQRWIESAATDDATGAITVPYADLTSWLAHDNHPSTLKTD